MLTMVHANPARLAGGMFYVDRKFHTGMQEYLRHLGLPLLSVHPELPPAHDHEVMDLIAVPEAEMGYRVATVASASYKPAAADLRRLEPLVAASRVVCGDGFGVRQLAKKHGVPLVAVVEYNLKTTMVFASASTHGTVLRNFKRAQALRYYFKHTVPSIRQAALVHCNGYPIYDESRWMNQRRLLYLDSRMREDMVIGKDELERRLEARRGRRPRLIFSGRFEAPKGALEAVTVAGHCHRGGLDFEMHLYGQGSLRGAMDRAVKDLGLEGKVIVHDPIPYPELVRVSRGFDLFVCCHIQDDPSCTYVEAMGCGLPVAGYGNAMWSSMCDHSGAGVVAPVGEPDLLAAAIRELCSQPARFELCSRNARRFALEHTFEREFTRRTDSLRELYQAAEGGDRTLTVAAAIT